MIWCSGHLEAPQQTSAQTPQEAFVVGAHVCGLSDWESRPWRDKTKLTLLNDGPTGGGAIGEFDPLRSFIQQTALRVFVEVKSATAILEVCDVGAEVAYDG